MCEIIVKKYISASRDGFLGNSFQLLWTICVRLAACGPENAVVRYTCIFNAHIQCSAFIPFKSAFTPCFSQMNNLYKTEEMLKSVWQHKCNLIHRLRSSTDSISSCGTSALCRSRIMRPGFTKVIRAILYGNGSKLSEMSLCEVTEWQKLSHFARAELGTCECVLSPLQKQLLRHAVSIAPWADLDTRCNLSRLCLCMYSAASFPIGYKCCSVLDLKSLNG